MTLSPELLTSVISITVSTHLFDMMKYPHKAKDRAQSSIISMVGMNKKSDI